MKIKIKYFHCNCGYSDDPNCGEMTDEFDFPDNIKDSEIEDYWYKQYAYLNDFSFISVESVRCGWCGSFEHDPKDCIEGRLEGMRYDDLRSLDNTNEK
jgi:hypothetical protein